MLAISKFGEFEVSVNVSLAGGAAPRLMDWPSTCRFCPRFVVALIVKFGELTVAVRDVEPAPVGVVKPLGVAISTFVVPGATGWNATVVVLVSALIVTGLTMIVPMVVSELVTVTLALRPVRMF